MSKITILNPPRPRPAGLVASSFDKPLLVMDTEDFDDAQLAFLADQFRSAALALDGNG